MNKERFEKIKENVYTRCSVATHTGIGLTHCDKEELELIDEISRLNNIIDELEKYITGEELDMPYLFRKDVLGKLNELKGEDK